MRDENGESAVHVAVRLGHIDVLETLLENGADFSAVFSNILTFCPASFSNLSFPKFCLRLPISIFFVQLVEVDGVAMTPSQLAAKHGHTVLVDSLIEAALQPPKKQKHLSREL